MTIKNKITDIATDNLQISVVKTNIYYILIDLCRKSKIKINERLIKKTINEIPQKSIFLLMNKRDDDDYEKLFKTIIEHSLVTYVNHIK